MAREEKQKTMVVMKGHPGTGKSTIARSLATSTAWPLIDKDDVRDCTVHLHSFIEPGVLNEMSYSVMWRMAETQLMCGNSVIVDSPLSRPHLFHTALQLSTKHGARLLVVECRADSDRELWKRRLEERSREGGNDTSKHKPSSWGELEALVAGYEGCYEYPMPIDTPVLILDSTAPSSSLSIEVVEWVLSANSSGVTHIPTFL